MKWIKKRFNDLEPHQKLGVGAEYHVAQFLKRHGILSKRMRKWHSAYDLLVNDSIRVEVKCASPLGVPNSSDTIWFVNFQRHGKVNEANVDYYIVRLVPTGCLGKAAIHLLFKAPVGVPTRLFSIRSLITKYAINACAMARLLKEKKFPDSI